MSQKVSFLIGIIVFTIFVQLPSYLHAIDTDNPILIISSYNPDAHNTSVNISKFIDEYAKLGGTYNVVIENMNCRSFPESIYWKKRMSNILTKYRGDNIPTAIILLGQEAWSSYLSQEDSTLADVPVLCAMTSRNAIILPDENVESLQDWMPESVDFISDSLKQQVKGGFIYEYNLKDNINIIRKLYPETRNIAFISDNTYGGVSLQAFVRKEMKQFPDLNLILLDGRSNTIYTIIEKIRELPANTAIILGTWRVDMNDGYFMRNVTYSMMEANPAIPAFSMSTVGFDHWAIGGVMPDYREFGRDMARQLKEIEKEKVDTANHIVLIKNRLRIDYQKSQELNINLSELPSNTIVINRAPSFYEQYVYEIWAVIIIVIMLCIAFLIALTSYTRTKRLKDKLELSGEQLRIAKERAEESNRLKSAFIANMSHEIRTPLNSIVGFANVLAMGDSTKEDAGSYYEIIQSNSELLLRLINDILDISRLETGKVTLALENYDIIQLSKQTLESVSYSRKSNNKFIFDSLYTSYEIETDPQRLQQVLINLISNSIKFTDSGVITLKVTIDEENSYVIFSVTDTGAGIPPEKHSQVFERFEKLNEHKQGTGLGLSISKLIVNKFGGEIWIDPEYTTGARFIFTHPITKKGSTKKD